MSSSRIHATQIWQAAVDAVRPHPLIHRALTTPTLTQQLAEARRIIVVGAGKAGAAMAEAVELEFADVLDRVTGRVNVPAELVRPLQKIRLHSARPAGQNQPTAEGVAGSEQILRLVEQAGPDDLVLCLLSGGGSALLPAPVPGVSLEDKRRITELLHACGATINELNAVRKHLSRIKGGRLAQAFHGKLLVSLIISDVIGDPLDVIASGPTAPDPTTFADALAVLDRYGLSPQTPASILAHLRLGASGGLPETPKALPPVVTNHIFGNNALALAAAAKKAEQLGYRVINLGPAVQGETRRVAQEQVGLVRNLRRDDRNLGQPCCVLSGGETTVTLSTDHGLGGRNQEFVLAALLALGPSDLEDIVILSGGTDGEDGPTDAAGAIGDAATLQRADELGVNPETHLTRHDAYHFFDAVGDLFKPGLTETNVMDIRLILSGGRQPPER